jgi:Ca-activated chloride channel family protein
MIFRFAHPVAFVILLLAVVVVVYMVRRGWRLDQPVMRYSDVRLVNGIAPGWRVRFRRMPDIMRLIAWVLLVVALARPQSGRGQEVIRGQGLDIVLTLDISGSMESLDFAPQTRLDAAKAVISNFISGREFDRIGLVVFAREAFHQAPPTLDYNVLQRLLAEVRLASELDLEDGTAIGQGIASSANMMRTSTALSKVIILLTDGANNAGSVDPMTAAQAVASLGIRVYTIGMGRADFAAAQGDEIDEATLQEIATTTDGRYFRAEDLESLQQIYDQINSLERSEVERQVFVQWQEQAGFLMIGALILLLTERILRHTVFQSVP